MNELKISEVVLDNNLLEQIRTFNLTAISNESLEYYINKKIILVTDENNNITSIAFIRYNEEFSIAEDLKNDLGYDNKIAADKNYLQEKVINKLVNGITLDAVESITKGLNAGTKIVNYLKEKYNSILLYALAEATTYWNKQSFNNIEDCYYIWSR
jgi:hypothetical protein